MACLVPLACQKRQGPSQEEAPTVAVEIWRAETQTIPETRRISGDVMPWEIIPLSFKVGGRLTRVLIEEGQSLTKGQLVAVLDSKDYALMRDLAAAQVKAIQPHVGRAEKLMASEAVSPSQMDQLRSQLEAARIQASQAEAQLSYARLTSPIDGIIVKKMASVGDLTDPTHPVGVIAHLERVKVILTVPQQDLPLFAVNKEIELREPAGGRAFMGKIHSVGYAADAKTRTFPVTVEVANKELLLRAGMIVEAVLRVGDLTGIFVPLDALTRDAGGRPSVLLVDLPKGTAFSRAVELGAIVGDKVQVLSGVSAGEAVIVRGHPTPGDAVTVRENQDQSTQAKTP